VCDVRGGVACWEVCAGNFVVSCQVSHSKFQEPERSMVGQSNGGEEDEDEGELLVAWDSFVGVPCAAALLALECVAPCARLCGEEEVAAAWSEDGRVNKYIQTESASGCRVRGWSV